MIGCFQERDYHLSPSVFAPVWFLFNIAFLAYDPLRYWMHILVPKSFIWMLKLKQAVLKLCMLACVCLQRVLGALERVLP